MIAIILAAGMGTRMYPLTKNRPKALLPLLDGSTFLDHLLSNIQTIAQIQDVVVTINPKHHKCFTEWRSNHDVTLYVAQEDNNVIEKRLKMAVRGDFAIAIYNPSSKKRADYLKRACEIMLEEIEGERACGYIENIGREGTKKVYCTLSELKDKKVNMFTTVFIGNSQTKIQDNALITPRGYQTERKEIRE